MAPHIQVEHLYKIFGEASDEALEALQAGESPEEVHEGTGCVIAVNDATFSVEKGEVFVVMGLSGSGKSTLVRCLVRLIEPTAGVIQIDGEDITRYSAHYLQEFRRHKMAMVFQHYGLLPHRKVLDNAAYGLEIRGMSRALREEKAREALDKVGLSGWEDNYPDELSGGMQQRVGLARALALDTDLLLMDEPFSGLDPLIRREMQDELIRLQEELQKTVVFITHDLDEALKIGDRIALMRDGAIVQLGAPDEIVSHPADEYVQEFTQEVRKAEVLPVRSIMNPPRAIVYGWQGPRVALRKMREFEEETAFIVRPHNGFVGIVTYRDALRAAAQRLKRVDEVAQEPPLKVSPEATIQTIVPGIIDYDQPMPVLDEKGHLVGEVHRTAVLDLAFAEEEEQAEEEAAAVNPDGKAEASDAEEGHDVGTGSTSADRVSR